MLVLLSLNCNRFRLIEISCICEVFQKFTRAKVHVQILGHAPIPKERREKTQTNHAHKLLKKKVAVRISYLHL